MSWLREILEEEFLLKEDVSSQGQDIESAVENMHPAHIIYKGPSGGGTGDRVIYPVAYGTSTAGNLVVRAFQPQGSTSSEVPAWKFFRVDRIERWETDNSQTFNPGELRGFNEDDAQMEDIYAVSPMKSETPKAEVKPEKPEEPKEPEKIVTNHPVSSREVDNGGADKETEADRYNYSGYDAIRDVLGAAGQKVSKPMDPEIQKNIDKLPGNPDNTPEMMPVRDSVPVTDSEVEPEKPTLNTGNNNAAEPVNNGPITDDDVNSEDIDNAKKPASLTESFRNLMNRMNNLYND